MKQVSIKLLSSAQSLFKVNQRPTHWKTKPRRISTCLFFKFLPGFSIILFFLFFFSSQHKPQGNCFSSIPWYLHLQDMKTYTFIFHLWSMFLDFLWRWFKERYPQSLESKMSILNPRTGWGTSNKHLVRTRMARTEDQIWRREWKDPNQSSFQILRVWIHPLWGKPCPSLESHLLSVLQPLQPPPGLSMR